MSQRLCDEIIGWCGTAMILFAYALGSFGILSPATIFYQVLNVIGSLGIMYISLKKKAYQPSVLNIIWAAIALIAIIRLVWF